MKQKLKGETDKSTTVDADFNISLSTIDGTGREKISTDVEEKQYEQPSGSNQQRQKTPRRESRAHTVFKCTSAPQKTLHGTIKQIPTHLKELKSYRVCFWTTMELTQKSTTEK